MPCSKSIKIAYLSQSQALTVHVVSLNSRHPGVPFRLLPKQSNGFSQPTLFRQSSSKRCIRLAQRLPATMTRTLASARSDIPYHHSFVVSKNTVVVQGVPNPLLLETCYILRTYERHGRPQLNDPWSLRQSLVYHKDDRETENSVWIFVQLFQCCKDALWKEFSQPDTWHLLRPHKLFLEIILPDWRWYFDYQRQFIREFVGG